MWREDEEHQYFPHSCFANALASAQHAMRLDPALSGGEKSGPRARVVKQGAGHCELLHCQGLVAQLGAR